MKNTIAILTLSVAAAYSSFGQGEVIFSNGNHQQTSVNSAIGGASTGVAAFTASVTTYYYALFSSVSATTVNGSANAVIPTALGAPGSYAWSDNNWTFDGYGVSGASPGKFTAQTPDSNGGADVQIPGQPAAAQFVVVGWSGNIGSTLTSLENWLADTSEQGVTGWVGQSVVSGTFSTGSAAAGSLSQPVQLLSGTAPGLNGILIGEYTTTAVPEPSTIALGVMGSLSLLALRRKKA